MALEIEWRFLVTRLPRIPPAARRMRLVQGYLTRGTPAVRVRLAGDEAWLSVKGAALPAPGGGPVARPEFEYRVPPADAEAMLALCPARVEKTRLWLPGGIELDLFEGAHTGLVLAELEVTEAGAAPSPPEGWEWRDISGDGRYSNQGLAFEGLPSDWVCAAIGASVAR
jgi:CYTH domain-containing protein